MGYNGALFSSLFLMKYNEKNTGLADALSSMIGVLSSRVGTYS